MNRNTAQSAGWILRQWTVLGHLVSEASRCVSPLWRKGWKEQHSRAWTAAFSVAVGLGRGSAVGWPCTQLPDRVNLLSQPGLELRLKTYSRPSLGKYYTVQNKIKQY